MKTFSVPCFCPIWDKHNCQLEQNLHSLKDAVKQLKNNKESLKIKIEREESSYKKPTFSVTDWLFKSDRLEAETEDVIARGQEELLRREPGCCFTNCFCSSSEFGKTVWEKLNAVNQFLIDGNFDIVVERTPSDFVDLVNVEATLDFESGLDDVWKCVEDDNIGIIGIYGMPGVGKTTLLKKIKDKLPTRGKDFGRAIWVSVSREANVDAIQKLIYKRLKSSLLGSRKFILLLDDVWCRLDLLKLGVPLSNENGSKVILTTRSESVCYEMGAQIKLKLKCLSRRDAIDLLLMKDGVHQNNSRPYLVDFETINTEFCQGLPLALVAVKAKINNWVWENALSTLQTCPSSLPGMDHIFRIIEPSFESLEDDILKNCFMYSCLLPNLIRKDELIKLWIGEGILNIYSKNLGDYIIKRLKGSCLLEGDEANDVFWMHNVIRAFGLWLAREHGRRESKYLVQEWRVEKWTEAVRISIYDQNDDVMLPQSPCPQLQTLLIRNTEISALPMEWPSMNVLGVLDLSKNRRLMELPSSIGSLANLQYLNLSLTSIKELPDAVKNLGNLKLLLLDYTENFQVIPKRLISSFSSLQVFSKLANERFDDETLLEELESAEQLSEISISIFSYLAAERMLNSIKLQSWIRNLSIKQVGNLTIPISVLSRMLHLEELILEDCEDLLFETYNTQYFVLTLRSLQIRGCSGIRDLCWLIFAPRIETLVVCNCESLLEIIGNDFESEEIKEIDERLGILSNLKKLYLEDLQPLSQICHQALHFPALLDIFVIDCPKLRKLPFHSTSARRLRGIKGSKIWWDHLEWEDVAVGENFDSKFQDDYGAGQVQETDVSGSATPRMVQEVSEPLSTESISTVVLEDITTEPVSHTDVTLPKGKGKSMLKSPIGIGRKSDKHNEMEIASPETKGKWPFKFPIGIKRKRKLKHGAKHAPSSTKADKLVLESLIGIKGLQNTWPKPFTYKELVEATSSFSDFNCIVEGGFGRVYKGVLSSGEVVAVKILRDSREEVDKLFWAEIETLGRIHHRNIVRLLGFCQNKNNKYLVHEFLPNYSLMNHLHGDKKSTINWSTRMKIALGSAKGLAYLHEDCEPSIIHRNIKPHNILLDNNFEPKISGFDLALFVQDCDGEIEETVVGTMGYLDPEYFRRGTVTVKADVYSFGMVLLELVTGRTFYDLRSDNHIRHWVKYELKRGQTRGETTYYAIIDPQLDQDYDEDEVDRMIGCALACVRADRNRRPPMSQIVEALKGNIPMECIWQEGDDTFLHTILEYESPSPSLEYESPSPSRSRGAGMGGQYEIHESTSPARSTGSGGGDESYEENEYCR